MNCRYCGSEDVEYRGIDDGGGDYGESVCDQWHCNECNSDFEEDCFDNYESWLENWDEAAEAPRDDDAAFKTLLDYGLNT